MIKLFFRVTLGVVLFSSAAMAVDLPGGVSRTATSSTAPYELLLAPSYAISPGGAYLTSQLRMQMGEDVGLGIGFGAGELGYNFGIDGVWYISPDTASQPAFAIVGGMYINRLTPSTYFMLKVSPIVSKSFKTSFGKVSPYAGVQLEPSFRLGNAANDFSMKLATGAQFTLSSLDKLQLWTEVGFGLIHSINEIVVGISYPFNTLGS